MPEAGTLTNQRRGTLLRLNACQVTGFINGDICPFCKKMNLIFRSWREDYICGWCREVFRRENRRIYHLGHQDQLD